MNQQVSRDSYTFSHYSGVDRFASYYYQLREILKTNPKTVLEVGVGDGVVGNYLRSHTVIEYTSVDVADDLHPDAIGDVRSLPFSDASFDVICAFEVLEHLPYEDFETALEELARVSKKHVLLSLPHFGPPVKFLFKIPFLPEVQFSFKIPFAKTHYFNGQHYWEIGKRGYAPARIRKTLKQYFTLKGEFVPFENQYHHFFVLEKKHG